MDCALPTTRAAGGESVADALLRADGHEDPRQRAAVDEDVGGFPYRGVLYRTGDDVVRAAMAFELLHGESRRRGWSAILSILLLIVAALGSAHGAAP